MEKKQYTAAIYTLGCKVNQYESEAIAEELARRNILVCSHEDVCDAYIINTCTVTAESDRKARQFIRRAIQKNPLAIVVVCGCYAQVSPDRISEIEGVDYVLGNADKLYCATVVESLLKNGKPSAPTVAVTPIDSAPFEPMKICRFERTRAYLKIEDGCESHCAYCIIPSARGKIRSKPMREVLDEVKILIDGGCREIVLTGIETASYGKDIGDINLATLLCEVDKIAGRTRIRLGSLDPSLITPEFVSKIAPLSSLSPHFHLSLQSGSSRVLAKMKRKYNADMAMRAIQLLRDNIPYVKFTTDVIVGFPGETDEDFEETVRFAKDAEFLMMHIFPYSKREGTLAAEMRDQVPSEIKKARAVSLSSLADEIRKDVLARSVIEAPLCEVLFETYSGGYAKGHTPDFIEVSVPSSHPLHAEFRSVMLNSSDGTQCFGTLCD